MNYKDINVNDVTIVTGRLILRAFQESDLNDFFEYASVPGVGEAAGWPHHESIEASKEILDMFTNENKVFAITFEGKVIGSLGIENYNEEFLPEEKYQNRIGREIGYVLSKDYWGKGLMTEAVEAVINYLFTDLKLDFIVCGHFVENNRSARVQDKCGFKAIKTVIYSDRMGNKKETTLRILENKIDK